MPSARVSSSARIAMAVLCVLAPGVWAQEKTSGGTPAVEDPTVIIARTINPRIAYRGIPTEQNPIHTEATLFPARTFHAALDGTIGELLGDEALGARGSAGLHAGVAAQSVTGLGLPGGSGPFRAGTGTGPTPIGVGAGATPVGPAFGDTISRVVGGSTAGFGDILGAMPALVPTQQGGGP